MIVPDRAKMNKFRFCIFLLCLLATLQINIVSGQMNMAAKHSEVFRLERHLDAGIFLLNSNNTNCLTFIFRKKYCRPSTCNKCRSYLLRTGIENTNSQQLYFLCSTLAIYDNCCQFQVEGPSLFTG